LGSMVKGRRRYRLSRREDKVGRSVSLDGRFN
jgi:hypothetical protein